MNGHKYRLTKVRIKNYKGISFAEVNIGPGGAIIAGQNGAGKTTIRDAIVDALISKGATPDRIRVVKSAPSVGGAPEETEGTEIILDMEAITARRRITPTGSTVTVTNSEGDKWSKPQTRLEELFGAMLDPLAFFRAKGPEQRKLVLEACPMPAPTADDFQRWIGKYADQTIPNVEGMHGLEAIEKVRAIFFDRRRDAKAMAKKATEAVEKIGERVRAFELTSEACKGVVVPTDGLEDVAVTEAKAARLALDTRAAQVAEQAKKTAGTRERIAVMRVEIERLENDSQSGPTLEQIEEARAKLNESSEKVERLQRELDAAISENGVNIRALAALQAEDDKVHACDREAARLRTRADELEASLTAFVIEPVTPEDIAAADAKLADAEANAAKVKAVRAELDALAEQSKAIDEAKECADEVAALTRVVDTLADVAPRELLERVGGIPGLTMSGDSILLDGVNVNDLCGAERMRFAVDLAKRLSGGGGKLLCVDGLEAIDEVNRPLFVQMAREDGWQLIGTLVAGGDLHVIELE